MKRSLGHFSKVSVFYTLYVVFFTALAFILLIIPKVESHLWLNRLNSPFFDKFFFYMTELGNGVFVVIIAVFLMFYRYRYAIGVFATFAISEIITQLIKHLTDLPRPIKYFENIANLHVVEGVKMLSSHSFPSGHSASAFALCLSLAIILKNRWWQVFMFILAITIAYSRVYLSQHFLVDIWAGSAIGTLVCAWYWNYEQKFQWNWLDKSLLSRNHTHNKQNY
ncbi:MAG TPA: phosphatase PAP2 family protein [Bacteroidales bacterium]|nr:phosphatase PAP2 family protein [Bacteroidales bacterium]